MTRSLQEVVPSFAVAKVYQIPNTNQILTRKSPKSPPQSCTHFPLNKTLTTMEKILRRRCNIPPLPLGIALKSVPKSSMSSHFIPRPYPKGAPRPSPALGLTHEITIVRGQGRQGVYTEDRSIPALGVDMPSEYLLLRRDEYTRVYTIVYPRVHNSIHACTLPRSKYILCRAGLYVYSLGIIPRIFSDGLRLPGI